MQMSAISRNKVVIKFICPSYLANLNRHYFKIYINKSWQAIKKSAKSDQYFHVKNQKIERYEIDQIKK